MKRIAVVCLLVLSLVTSLLTGCNGKELTQEELEQLVNDVLAANAEVDTVKFDISTTTTMEMIGGSEPGFATMSGDGTGAIDSPNQAMQMIINMDIDIPGKARKSVPMESYFVDGWMHVKVSIEEKGAEWVKMKLPDGMWDSQSQISRQIELLKTADRVGFLGTEDVNGADCYIVEIVPGAEALSKLLSELQMPDTEGVDTSKLDLTDVIKEMSLKQWIAEDGYLIMKSETRLVMEISPADVGADEAEFQNITAEQSAIMTFYDYSEPVAIELPAEALEK
jgi:hypothetical protein